MPKKFTENMEWIDWKETLTNFLKYQPGRNSVTLKYVIKENFAAVVLTNMNFIDNYVYRTLLTGIFNANAPKVHSYIAQLIYENAVAKKKLLPHRDAADGHVYYFALHEFYKGVVSNAKYALTD